MLQSYINNINHNRYLKLYYTNTYNYSKLSKIIINIKFKKSVNNEFNILCTFFLFKNLFLKNGLPPPSIDHVINSSSNEYLFLKQNKPLFAAEEEYTGNVPFCLGIISPLPNRIILFFTNFDKDIT